MASITLKICYLHLFNLKASLAGLEPTTRCLEGSRSIQLSYRDELSTIQMYHEEDEKVKVVNLFS